MSADQAPGETLNRTIGLYGAVTLAVGIVLGAGMLSLPGLVYHESGGWAVLSWLSDAVLVVPLLFIFAVLGSRFPTAGGVAGFVGAAFPKLRIGCSYLLVGTFSLGLPAIAITGAGYATSTFDIATTDGGRWIVAGPAIALIALVLAMTWTGAKFAGLVQNLIVTLLVGCLIVVTALSASSWGSIDFQAGDPSWFGVWRGMGLAFFAYTGWEMLSFMTEEFKNPRRDFPLAVVVSFVLVVVLYVGASLAVQALVPLGHPLLERAPYLAVIQAVTAVTAAGPVLVIVVLAIIIANLNGACWAASRLIFDIGRNGWIPKSLALGSLHRAEPRPAIAMLGGLLCFVLFGYGLGFWTLSDLLRIAGQNFFILYTLSVASFLHLSTSVRAKLFGTVTLVICVVFAGIFTWGLAIAAAMFAAPYAVRYASTRLTRIQCAAPTTDVITAGLAMKPAFAVQNRVDVTIRPALREEKIRLSA